MLPMVHSSHEMSASTGASDAWNGECDASLESKSFLYIRNTHLLATEKTCLLCKHIHIRIASSLRGNFCEQLLSILFSVELQFGIMIGAKTFDITLTQFEKCVCLQISHLPMFFLFHSTSFFSVCNSSNIHELRVGKRRGDGTHRAQGKSVFLSFLGILLTFRKNSKRWKRDNM